MTHIHGFFVQVVIRQDTKSFMECFWGDCLPVFKMPIPSTKIFGDMGGHFKNR
jgi:hypothetical protein